MCIFVVLQACIFAQSLVALAVLFYGKITFNSLRRTFFLLQQFKICCVAHIKYLPLSLLLFGLPYCVARNLRNSCVRPKCRAPRLLRGALQHFSNVFCNVVICS